MAKHLILNNFFIVALFVFLLLYSGCTASGESTVTNSEPIIPNDVVMDLLPEYEYVVAPTFLPEDLEFKEISEQYSILCSVDIVYESPHHGSELIISYPCLFDLNNRKPTPDILPELPSDAFKDILVNNMKARLYYGSYDLDTWQRIQRMQTNDEGIIEGIWDYTHSLRLVAQVPFAEQVVSVTLMAYPYTQEWISDHALIDVAESLKIIE